MTGLKLISYSSQMQTHWALKLWEFLMPGFINRGRDTAHGKSHRIQVTCNDKFRSETDLLHRFIAQLNLPHFKIEKVDIWESPVSADIMLSEGPEDVIDGHGIAYLFKRRRAKVDSRFKLSLSVNKIDRLGRTFFIGYDFADQLQQDNGPQEKGLNENIHLMMETAFKSNPSFQISRMSGFES